MPRFENTTPAGPDIAEHIQAVQEETARRENIAVVIENAAQLDAAQADIKEQVQAFHEVEGHGGSISAAMERYGDPSKCPFLQSLGSGGMALIERMQAAEKDPNRGPSIAELLAAKKAEREATKNEVQPPSEPKAAERTSTPVSVSKPHEAAEAHIALKNQVSEMRSSHAGETPLTVSSELSQATPAELPSAPLTLEPVVAELQRRQSEAADHPESSQEMPVRQSDETREATLEATIAPAADTAVKSASILEPRKKSETPKAPPKTTKPVPEKQSVVIAPTLTESMSDTAVEKPLGVTRPRNGLINELPTLTKEDILTVTAAVFEEEQPDVQTAEPRPQPASIVEVPAIEEEIEYGAISPLPVKGGVENFLKESEAVLPPEDRASPELFTLAVPEEETEKTSEFPDSANEYILERQAKPQIEVMHTQGSEREESPDPTPIAKWITKLESRQQERVAEIIEEITTLISASGKEKEEVKAEPDPQITVLYEELYALLETGVDEPELAKFISRLVKRDVLAAQEVKKAVASRERGTLEKKTAFPGLSQLIGQGRTAHFLSLIGALMVRESVLVSN